MDLQITGLAQVQERLTNAAPNLVARAFVRSLDAGIKVIEADLQVRTPVQDQDYGMFAEAGSLADALTTEVQIDSSLRGGTAAAGYGKQGHVARLVEFGHEMVTHDGKTVGHVPAHPFMRQAFEESADAAIEAFAETLIESLSVIE